MNIGLDVHNVIDAYPEIFRKLSKQWIKQGHQVHIITGQSWREVEDEVEKAGICYTHHFSIIDYHKELGTEMWDNDSRGEGIWMDEKSWAKSKGDYCFYSHIDVHFDDTEAYKEYFTGKCKFILINKTGDEERIYQLSESLIGS